MTQPKTSPISIHQKMIGDAVRIGQKMPFIHALVELDVTQARSILRVHRKQTGEKISFSAYILSACAKAVKTDTKMQRWKARGNRLVEPPEVDFLVPMESLTGPEPVLTSRLIRNADEKEPKELSQILSDVVHNDPPIPEGIQGRFMSLPWFLRKHFYAGWMSSPSKRKKYFGTVYFSSIMNYSADRRTWGIPTPMHSLGIFIGTTSKRVVPQGSGFETRDMLQITVSVDHRVNNGGDMGRFVHRLKHILEHQNLVSSDLS